MGAQHFYRSIPLPEGLRRISQSGTSGGCPEDSVPVPDLKKRNLRQVTIEEGKKATAASMVWEGADTCELKT